MNATETSKREKEGRGNKLEFDNLDDVSKQACKHSKGQVRTAPSESVQQSAICSRRGPNL